MSDPLYTSVISYFANVQQRSRKHEQQRSTVFPTLIRSQDLTNHLTQFSFCKTSGCETNLLCAMLNIFVRFKCFIYCLVDIFQKFFQLHFSLHCLQKRNHSDTLVLLNAICTFLPGLYNKDRIDYICNLFSSCRVLFPRFFELPNNYDLFNHTVVSVRHGALHTPSIISRRTKSTHRFI